MSDEYLQVLGKHFASLSEAEVRDIIDSNRSIYGLDPTDAIDYVTASNADKTIMELGIMSDRFEPEAKEEAEMKILELFFDPSEATLAEALKVKEATPAYKTKVKGLYNTLTAPEKPTEETLTPSEPGGRTMNIGADYQGIKQIMPKENDRIFIPTSYNCFDKCINRYIELNPQLKDYLKSTAVPIDNRKFNQKLPTSRKKALALLKNPKVAYELYFPTVFKVYYSKEKGMIVQANVGKKKLWNNMRIGLLYLDKSTYHAVLIKSPKALTKEDITIHFTKQLELKLGFSKTRFRRKTKRDSYVISYDIETHVVMEGEKKRLLPYALSWSLVNLNEGTFSEATLMIEGTDYLMDRFIHEVSRVAKGLGLESIQVFAHNGARFDNIFVKKCSDVKYLSQIRKGNNYKMVKLVTTRMDDPPTVILKDSLPFVLASLDRAAQLLGCEHGKMDFDIVDKSKEWYQANEEWKEYLRLDVVVLSEILIKLENMYRELNMSITNFVGLPAAAWHALNTNCYGLKDVRIASTPSMSKFISESIYGGRVICWKRFYDEEKDGGGGLVSIDFNSLYPSAMALYGYPIGPAALVKPGIQLEELLKKPHFIVEIEFEIPNIRYPLHPWRAPPEDENAPKALLFPSAGVYTGVYNDVDVREMLKDGYKVLTIRKGISWNQSRNIFYSFISKIYNRRNAYKALGQDNPEYKKEYIMKILLNATFGKFNEKIHSGDFYAQDVPTDGFVKARKELPNGQVESSVKYLNPRITKPTQIASYILSYSKKIVNKMIRFVGPENIYYGDTDSLYVTREVFESSGLKMVDGLGGYKNDYGDGSYITKAIFLDMKRYYLKIKNGDKVFEKTKFNGLSFRNLRSVADFIKDDKGKYPYEQIYMDLLAKYKERHELAGAISKIFENCGLAPTYSTLKVSRYVRDGKLDRGSAIFLCKNIKKIDELKITMAFERFHREIDGVYIDKRTVGYVVNPSKRGNWVGDEFYGLGYQFDKPDVPLAKPPSPNIAAVDGFERKKIMEKSHGTYLERKKDKICFHLYSARPLQGYKNIILPEDVPMDGPIKTDFFIDDDMRVFYRMAGEAYFRVNVFGVGINPVDVSKLKLRQVMAIGTETKLEGLDIRDEPLVSKYVIDSWASKVETALMESK